MGTLVDETQCRRRSSAYRGERQLVPVLSQGGTTGAGLGAAAEAGVIQQRLYTAGGEIGHSCGIF